ncbi:MAG: type II secretion system protein [Dehalococcoidia bacterium]|nr:type II secretion system protein [Dehalococcoidia bacterium]
MLPKRGQKGFTLIELLIVVAILSILAAIVIPNVSRAAGSGEDEARRTEKHNIELAIAMLVTENGLSQIPCPKDYSGGSAYNDMRNFPDTHSDDTDGPDDDSLSDKATDPSGNGYSYPGDGDGYVLYGHDITGDGSGVSTVNYTRTMTTKYYYTCEEDGTLRQWSGSDVTTATEYTD